ncbi:hypothetical protein K4A83_22365 [Spirulina subsalsa FACHB-351]|uniref:Uncharacterized protein n=1 Tax=Spirulina subsalsa FACHB-351 TaxID=234711 RepID=A0ABT3LBT3_9CYAN|nr:hypothetical protein [Spirulina subsalsa]MCW6038975.1 hypothetical protein [Spirulina subsalsa FACHB-351]
MSDNLLNELRQKRQRTVVPQREDTLIQDTTSPLPESSLSSPPDALQTENTLAELQAKLARFPKMRRRSAVVLEDQIDQALTHFCKDSKITLEVFIEATWQVAAENPSLLNAILVEAQKRYRSRKEAGQLRRLITMLSQEEN